MSLHNEHQESIRRYLLGELSKQELEQIEQLVMSDDGVYEELLFAEDDLVDEYLSGTLSEDDRTKFKKRFLVVPELRQSVSFASALRKHALETAPQVAAEEPRPSLFDRLRRIFLQPAFAASYAALLIVAVALNVWLFRQNFQLNSRSARLGAPTRGTADLEELEAARQRNEQLSAELIRQQELVAEEKRKLQQLQREPTRQTGGSGVLAVTLLSGFVRDSGEWKKFSLPSDKRGVSFQLDVAGDDYNTYQARLETIDGQPKLPGKNLKFGPGNIVTFYVPSRILKPGDYRIVLNGIDSSKATSEIGSYYFRVLP